MSDHVSELLNHKGRSVITVSRTTSVLEAVSIMAEHNIGCVLVVTQSGALSGICSERDVFRKVILEKKNPAKTEVAEVMTAKRGLITVKTDTTLGECMELMTTKRVRHLPVLDDAGKLTGLISIGDVVKILMSEREQMINQLEQYIGSSL
jgi:CBS domain-containing protein